VDFVLLFPFQLAESDAELNALKGNGEQRGNLFLPRRVLFERLRSTDVRQHAKPISRDHPCQHAVVSEFDSGHSEVPMPPGRFRCGG
jgi:hypothetical protein